MRKLVLIAAFALASVSAQAAERIDRVPADIDAPAAAAAPATATHPPPRHLPPWSRKPPGSKPTATKPTATKPTGSRPPARRPRTTGRPCARPRSRKRAGSPPRMAFPGDAGCHHRGGGRRAGICLAEPSPRRRQQPARDFPDEDEDHLPGSRRVRPLFQGGRPHLPALQSAAASDHRSLTGEAPVQNFFDATVG